MDIAKLFFLTFEIIMENVLKHRIRLSIRLCFRLCGEIVAYDLLVSEHLPRMHPETFSEGTRFDYEEMPYEQYLQNKMNREAETLGSVFRFFS